MTTAHAVAAQTDHSARGVGAAGAQRTRSRRSLTNRVGAVGSTVRGVPSVPEAGGAVMWVNGWSQAKTDAEDPRLATPQGAYQQLKDRVWGGLFALVVVLGLAVLITSQAG